MDVPIYILAGQSNALFPGVDLGLTEGLRELGPNYELVKFAVGGTSLAPSPALDWSPASSDELFDTLVDLVLARADYVLAQGHTPVFRGLIWVQGENDATTSLNALSYGSRLGDLAAALRADLAAPELPVVVSQLSSKTLYTYTGQLRAGQEARDALDPYMELVDPSALAMRVGNVHFPVESTETIGRAALGALNPAPHPTGDYPSLSRGAIWAGSESADIYESSFYPDSLHGLGGNDILKADFGNNEVYGGEGNDLLSAMLGNDLLDGGPGNDTIWGSINSGSWLDGATPEWDRAHDIDTVRGGDGDDRIRDLGGSANQLFGDAGNDWITAWEHDDTVQGGLGADLLECAGGRDFCSGGAGADTVDPGPGTDTLSGGPGADLYRFRHTPEADQILDLRPEDRIDLSALDANTTVAGDQAFVLAAAFSGTAGELVVSAEGGLRTLQADTNGDGVADWFITIYTTLVLDSTNFVL